MVGVEILFSVCVDIMFYTTLLIYQATTCQRAAVAQQPQQVLGVVEVEPRLQQRPRAGRLHGTYDDAALRWLSGWSAAQACTDIADRLQTRETMPFAHSLLVQIPGAVARSVCVSH